MSEFADTWVNDCTAWRGFRCSESSCSTTLRFEVFMKVTMKNALYWDVMPVALVITGISEDRIASIIRVKRTGQLGTTLAVTGNRSRLRRFVFLTHKN
jgi:hypothetical protein